MAKNRATHPLLTQIDKLKLEIKQLSQLHKSLLPVIQEKLRIEWVYNSNAIEGNTLTLGETAFFLREGLTSEGKPLKDFLDTKNHAEALDGLDEIIKRKRPITESVIKELHSVLLKDVEHSIARGANGKAFRKPILSGAYKKHPNHVLTVTGKIHHYTDPLHVRDEMEKLITFYKKESGLHPVERAVLFHYRFVSIHPFDDGNGRLARILMNLILMKDGYPPCVIRFIRRKKYLETLENVDRSENMHAFIEFVAEELTATMQIILKVLKDKKVPDFSESLEPIRSIHFTREAREALILKALRDGALSIQQLHATLTQLKRPTLKGDLQRLVAQKKILRNGIGKSTTYLKRRKT